MSECQTKLVWVWLSEKEETERSEVTDNPVSESFSFAEKVKVQRGVGNWGLVVGCWIFAIGLWPLAIGFWLLPHLRAQPAGAYTCAGDAGSARREMVGVVLYVIGRFIDVFCQ